MGRELTCAVSCHSSLEYAGRPRSFEWQGERLMVTAVDAGWRTPDGRHFRVRTQDGCRFDLVYHILDDRWSIQPV